MTRANSGTKTALLRHLNTRQVFAALQHHGPMSRAEISRLTGISGPTITRTVTSLLEAQLLEEGELQQAALGRPGKVVRLANKTVGVLGLVIGVESCDLVAAGLDGILDTSFTHSFPTPARYADLLAVVMERLTPVSQRPEPHFLGLGISVPGLLHQREQRTLVSPNLHQLDGHQLGKDLRAATGLEVALLQESHALCLAERTYGAARGVEHFAMLDVTDGLGLGVVAHGRFLDGQSGLAGELGHVTVDLEGKRCGCGNRGCLETVATDKALTRALSTKYARELTMEEIIHLLRIGQLEAEAEITRVLQYLSVALAAVINIFNPAKLFIYGRLFDTEIQVFPRLLEYTRERALSPSFQDCEIIRARGNKHLGAIAGMIHHFTTSRNEDT